MPCLYLQNIDTNIFYLISNITKTIMPYKKKKSVELEILSTYSL